MTAIDTYLAAVRARIQHLPTAEREAILEDLSAQLTEEAAEPGMALGERLGPPSAFAAEFVESLRVAARPTPIDARLNESQAARRWWADARPTWWMLRPFLIIGALVLLVGRHTRDGLTLFVLLALGAVAAAAAVAWSNREGDAGGRWNLAWTAGGVISAVAVAAVLVNGSARRTVVARPVAALEMKCAMVRKARPFVPPSAKLVGPGRVTVDMPPVCRRFVPFFPDSTTTTTSTAPTTTTTSP